MEVNEIKKATLKLIIELMIFFLLHYIYIHYLFTIKPPVGDPKILFQFFWIKYFLIRAAFYAYRIINEIKLEPLRFVDLLLALITINIYFVAKGGIFVWGIIVFTPIKVNVYIHIYLIAFIAFVLTKYLFDYLSARELAQANRGGHSVL